MFAFMHAFLRDKASRERASLSLADERAYPRRLRFGGMRAQGLRFRSVIFVVNKSLLYYLFRSVIYVVNKIILYYLNVYVFGSSSPVELQDTRLL
jgi:hypothetical protein